MIRWSYLIPRLCILGLVALAIWIGSDPLIKSAIIRSTQNVTGAKVEVAQIRTSLSNGKIFLKELRVADPRDPFRNLFQADMAYIKLDTQRLLHREIVIEDGKTSQVLFGSPRTEAGVLKASVPQQEKQSKKLAFQIPVRQLEQKWQDSFGSNSLASNLGELKTTALAEQIKYSWLSEMEKLRGELESLQAQRARTDEAFKSGILVSSGGDPANPLRRNEEVIKLASSGTVSLHNRIKAMYQTLEQLEDQGREDIAALVQASQEDAKDLASKTVVTEFDGETMSTILLSELQHEQVEEIIDWFRWFRNSIPDPSTDFRPAAQRGREIDLGGASRPNFLIKNLELDGEGRIAGQHLNFSGVVKDLSTEPELHDQPISFLLKAQGNQHLIVACNLDRRQPIWHDKFKVTCPGLDSAGRGLGSEQTLVVSLSDNVVETQVEIETLGEALSGTLSFRHTNAILHVDRMHPLAGGVDTALRINQEISDVSEFSTLVTLGGTIDEPVFEFQSELGERFAVAMNNLVGAKAVAENEQMRRELDARTTRVIQGVEKEIQGFIKEVAEVLDGEKAVVTALNENIDKLTRETRIR